MTCPLRKLFEWKLSTSVGGSAMRADAFIFRRTAHSLSGGGDTGGAADRAAEIRCRFTLDEETALALYAIDPAAAPAFILRRLPSSFWAEKSACFGIVCCARRSSAGRRFSLEALPPPGAAEQWQADVLTLAARFRFGAARPDSERQHPEGWGLMSATPFRRCLKLADAMCCRISRDTSARCKNVG